MRISVLKTIYRYRRCFENRPSLYLRRYSIYSRQLTYRLRGQLISTSPRGQRDGNVRERIGCVSTYSDNSCSSILGYINTSRCQGCCLLRGAAIPTRYRRLSISRSTSRAGIVLLLKLGFLSVSSVQALSLVSIELAVLASS